MKFKSDPGRLVTDSKTRKAIGRFDEKGIWETNDPSYIERAKMAFPVVDEKKSETTETRTCKKCGAVLESQGKLLAHYKTEHPKV